MGEEIFDEGIVRRAERAGLLEEISGAYDLGERKEREKYGRIFMEYKEREGEYDELKKKRDGIEYISPFNFELISSGVVLNWIGLFIIDRSTGGIERPIKEFLSTPDITIAGFGAASCVLGIYFITGNMIGNYHQKRKSKRIESKMQKLEQELHSEKYSGLEGKLGGKK